jgi:hypothetical protein
VEDLPFINLIGDALIQVNISLIFSVETELGLENGDCVLPHDQERA